MFNPAYAEKVRRWNPRTVSAPTWFDPAITPSPADEPDPYAVVWVGRLEVPKDPSWRSGAFAALVAGDPDEPWTLEVVGSGTLRPALEAQIAALPPASAGRITLRGRLAPADLAEVRSRSGVLLMTSHAGYEGFPRVLVEALASGLPAVVTEGSDTGGLVRPAGVGLRVRPRARGAGRRPSRGPDPRPGRGRRGGVAALSAPAGGARGLLRDVIQSGAPAGRGDR